VGEAKLVQALVEALEGRPVPYPEVVRSGRLIALALVRAGRPVTVVEEGPWAGIWDLERLTDAEAAAWGMWVATKIKSAPSPGRRSSTD
jgi:hypothetical protein